MKRSFGIYTRILAFMFIVFLSIASCKKTGLVSKELLLYVKGDYGAVNNTITSSLVWTPVNFWGNNKYAFPLYATHEVPADITVYINPNDSLVNKFNQDNGTNYTMLPASAYRINDTRHKISKGSLVSDSVTLEVTAAVADLTNTSGYVLPLTITKYESEDKGPQISSNMSTVYFIMPYKYNNIDSVQTFLTGTQMSRTGWSATVSNTFSGTYPATNLLDGNNSTAWRSSNSASAAKWFIINMGSTQTVSGFKLCPDYVTTTENPTQMTISTSDDNVTYKVQGIWKGTGPAASSNAANPDWKGVNFIAPVQARYFRFDITAWVSTNVAGMGEVYSIQ